jgi:hypothetical protein
MVRGNLIVLVDSLGENDQRISNEEVGNMIRQQLVYAVIQKSRLDVFVKGHVIVVVFGPVRWIRR